MQLLCSFCAFVLLFDVSIGRLNDSRVGFDNVEFAIIAGTQKSGTTVLAALLANHSDITFAKNKEAHYFDRTKYYERGFDFYLNKFSSEVNSNRKILADATPSYIASRKACQRISHDIPNAKLIVLLREPVARAYSEFQMKKRRVAYLNHFIDILRKHQRILHNCIVNNPSEYDKIQSCVPIELSNNVKWTKLMTALKHSYKVHDSWRKVVRGCFTKPTVSSFYSPQYLHGISGEQQPFSPDYASTSGNSALSQGQVAHPTNLSSLPAWQQQRLLYDLLGPQFDARSCWEYYPEGWEHMLSMKEAFVHEVDQFQACAMPIIANTTDSIELGSKERFTVAEAEVLLEQLDRAVDVCLKVRGGISSQYFYRSMYAVQLYHCFKERVKVVGSGRLRRHHQAVLAELRQFLGLSPACEAGTVNPMVKRNSSTTVVEGGGMDSTTTAVTITATVAVEGEGAWQNSDRDSAVESAVRQHFPNFSAATGWELHSTYPPLPAPLRASLQAFFTLQNRLLFALLGRDMTAEW